MRIRQRVRKRIVPLRLALAESRGSAPAPAVNDFCLGSSADGEGEEGVHRSFERAGTALHLGEEKPSLEGGEQSGGQVVRVDIWRELPVGV